MAGHALDRLNGSKPMSMGRRKGQGSYVGLICLLLGIAAVFVLASTAWASGYANDRLLVDTAWVAKHGQDSGVRLLDVRPLGEYRQAHIPGATHFDVGEVRVERNGVRGMLPEPEALNAIFGRHGIRAESTVVLYDAQGGLWASRVWFALDYMDHKDVRLLNGGWREWSHEGKPITRSIPKVKKVKYQGKLNPSKVANAEWLLAHLKDPLVRPLDSRTPAEYAGQDVRSARGGHIPGAENLNWVETVTGPNMTFKSAKELESLFQGAGVTRDKEVVPYCQTHVRGSHASFVLRLLGYEKVRGYDGSWQEWGNRSDVPIDK